MNQPPFTVSEIHCLMERLGYLENSNNRLTSRYALSAKQALSGLLLNAQNGALMKEPMHCCENILSPMEAKALIISQPNGVLRHTAYDDRSFIFISAVSGELFFYNANNKNDIVQSFNWEEGISELLEDDIDDLDFNEGMRQISRFSYESAECFESYIDDDGGSYVGYLTFLRENAGSTDKPALSLHSFREK